MTSILISILIGIAALIHLAPIVGLVSVSRMETLYGVSLSDPTMALLMRHRALLFGIIGVVMGIAAVYPPWQTMAITIGLISAVAFLLLAGKSVDQPPEIRKVCLIDWVALVCLLLATGLRYLNN
jgi:hypothetical protein